MSVSELKDMVARGEYVVDVQRVAEALLARTPTPAQRREARLELGLSRDGARARRAPAAARPARRAG